MLKWSLNKQSTVNKTDVATTRTHDVLAILLSHNTEYEYVRNVLVLPFFFTEIIFLESEQNHGISATSVFAV
jgi:hypothetical protein